ALLQADDMAAELIEGLGLFTRGDVHLRRGTVERAVVLGLRTLGAVHSARDVAHLLFDAAIDVARFRGAARHAVEKLVGLAARGLWGRLVAVGSAGCEAVAGQFVLVSGVGEAAQDAPREPLANGKPLTASSGSGQFPAI